MTRNSLLTMGLIAAFATSAAAGPQVSHKLPATGLRPSTDFTETGRSSAQGTQWKYGRDWQYYEWQGTAESYNAALRFAQCAVRFNPASVSIVKRPFGEAGDRQAMVRLAEKNRGCVRERAAVSPLLIRAALAETAIRGGRVDLQPDIQVGVPAVVDGYPLAQVSRCFVQKVPESVSQVLRTRPGDDSERVAANRLFRQAPECVPETRLSITPTAARVALIDAMYREASFSR